MAEVEKLDFQSNLKEIETINFIEFLKTINTCLMDNNVKNIDIHQVTNIEYKDIKGLNDLINDYPILRHFLKQQKHQIEKEDFVKSLTMKTSCEINFAELKKAYDKIYQPIFHGKSLRDLIVEYLGTQNDVYIEIFIEKNSASYLQARTIIQCASELYNDINFESNQTKYQSLEGKDEVSLSVQMEEFITSLEHLLVDLKESKKIYYNDQVFIANKEYKEIFQSYLNLKIDFESYCIKFSKSTPSKPGLLNFSTNDSEAFKSYNDIKFRCIDLGKTLFEHLTVIKTDFISIEEIEVAIQNYGNLLAQWNDIIAEKIQKNLKRFNPFHSLRSFVVTIEEIQALYILINKLHIFKKDFTVNTQNLALILENLQQNIVELKECRKYLNEYSKQKEWLEFYKNLESGFKLQIQELILFPTIKWPEIFESNFKLSYIESLLHPCIIDLDHTALHTLDEIQNNEKDILYYKYCEKLQFNLKSYCVNSNTSIDKINRELTDEKVSIENLNMEIAPVIIKSALSSSTELITINVYFHSGEKQEMEVDVEDKRLNLYSGALKEITQIPIADRYSVASALASALIAFNDEIKVFQTKNSNILSLLPDKINEQILSILNDKGIKEIKVQDNKRNLLIESILMENKESILIINDVLLNGSLVNDYYYQKEIINAFEKVGFKVRNLNTYELFVDKFLVFDELLMDID